MIADLWIISVDLPRWSFGFFLPLKMAQVQLCDINIGTHDRSFLLEIRCLSHLLGLNGKVFLIGTDGIQKFENLAYSHNFFRFLIAL